MSVLEGQKLEKNLKLEKSCEQDYVLLYQNFECAAKLRLTLEAI